MKPRAIQGILLGVLIGTPQEAARILGESVDFSRKGQNALRDGKAESRPQTAKP